MGRKKIRNYPTREHYDTVFSDYFKENGDKVIKETLERMGYSTVEEMRYHDIHDCWYDCGWVLISPKNAEQTREWRLDSTYRSDYDWVDEREMPYGTQSTRIKKIMVEIAVRDLGLQDELYVFIRLD